MSEHWDGTQWSVVPVPLVGTGNNPLMAITAIGFDNVWAVGFAEISTIERIDRTMVQHWDGSEWSVVPSPNNSANSNLLLGVGYVSDNEAWAVGSYSNASNIPQTLIEHYADQCGTATPTPVRHLHAHEHSYSHNHSYAYKHSHQHSWAQSDTKQHTYSHADSHDYAYPRGSAYRPCYLARPFCSSQPRAADAYYAHFEDRHRGHRLPIADNQLKRLLHCTND